MSRWTFVPLFLFWFFLALRRQNAEVCDQQTYSSKQLGYLSDDERCWLPPTVEGQILAAFNNCLLDLTASGYPGPKSVYAVFIDVDPDLYQKEARALLAGGPLWRRFPHIFYPETAMIIFPEQTARTVAAVEARSFRPLSRRA